MTRYPFNREHTQCPACLTKQRSVRKISNGRYTRTLDLYLPKNLNSCPRPLSRTENMRETSPKKQLCNNFVKVFVGNKVSSLHLCHAHKLVKYQYKLSSFLEKWAWFWLRRQTSCLPFRSTRIFSAPRNFLHLLLRKEGKVAVWGCGDFFGCPAMTYRHEYFEESGKTGEVRYSEGHPLRSESW